MNKNRLLFPSPSVLSGDETEAHVTDFESLNRKAIGEGAFGDVYRVRHKKTGENFAIKVIRKEKVIQSGMLPQVRREIRIMYNLSHPYIIKLYNHFEDDSNFYLVMELASNGNLYSRLARYKSFDERTTAQYVREVALAIQYLHNKVPPIIHRDIKPENILLDGEGRTKLCDFGWSNFFNNDRTRMTYCGTLEYLAPEMINKDGHDASLDIWNIGILMFELLAGHAPFQSKNQMELFNKILALRINFPKSFPFSARDLITKLLKVKPAERISVEQLLNHPWLKMNAPIRPTITQELVPEPLPCNPYEDVPGDIPAEDPIKPFSTAEYKVLSKKLEEEKKSATPTASSTPTPQPIVQKTLTPSASNTTVTSTISKLDQELSSARTDSAQIKQEINEKTEKIKRTEKRLAELTETLKKADDLIQNKQNSGSALDKRLKRLNTEIRSLTAQQDQENKLYRDYETLKTGTLEKQTELSLLKTQLSEMEKFSNEKTDQVDECDEELAKLKKRMEQVKRSNTYDRSELQQEILSLKSDIDTMQIQVNSANENNLERVLTQTQDALETLKARSKTEIDVMDKYQSCIHSHAEIDKNYTDMKLQLDEQIAQLGAKLQTEVQEVEKKLLQSSEPIVKNNDMIQLKKKLQESHIEQERTEEQSRELDLLNRKRHRAENDVIAFKTQIKDLNELVRMDNHMINQLSKKISDMNTEIKTYERRVR